MSIKPLPDIASNSRQAEPRHLSQPMRLASLQQRFYKRNGAWYVGCHDQSAIGPFVDKADAQMALMYYTAMANWPTDKQLREFARTGL